MPLTLDNITQSKTGSFEASSGSATLDAGTEAGSAVLIIAGLGGEGAGGTARTISTPAGFTAPTTSGATSHPEIRVFIKPTASAGETSWTLAVTGAAEQVVWAAFEITNLDSDWVDKVYLHNQAGNSTSVVASKTVGLFENALTYSGFTLAGFFAGTSTTTPPTIGGYTGGFYEYLTATSSGATRGNRLSVAAKASMVVETPSCTATLAPSASASAWMLTFTGADSLHATDVLSVFGAELGTATNLTTSTLLDGVVAPFDESVGTPAVVTTTARSGSYCLELASTAAAESVAWAQRTAPARGTLGSSPTTNLPAVWVQRLHFYLPSLPAADTDLWSAEAGSLANGAVLWYRTGTQKLGIKIGTGTEVLSDATVTAGQWIGVDLYYDPRATTHLCQWAVDYDASPADTTTAVPQTAASTAGMTAGGVSKVRHGWTSAVTATARYDDLVPSASRKSYPIGDVRVLPLGPDQAGTPTVSGTSGNFRTFSANGTLATWTASVTRTVLDEMPPTIGASADGLTQVTAASNDYVEVPMETYDCAANAMVPVGGRWYWAGWAASTTGATIGHELADEVGDFGFARQVPTDAEFDTTTLRWVTAVHRRNPNSPYVLTQARVDNLAIRFGFSTDATPDAGVHAVLYELAVQPAVVFGVLSAESEAFKVYVRQDRVTGAAVSYLVATPSGSRGATFSWVIDGTPGSQYVGPNTTFEKLVGAADVSHVTGIGLAPDPS